MENRPQHEGNGMLRLSGGVECARENEHGAFRSAEPLYGGHWVVFRERNGQGPKRFAAELVDRERGVVRTTVHSNVCRGQVLRFNRMQIQKKLMEELGVI